MATSAVRFSQLLILYLIAILLFFQTIVVLKFSLFILLGLFAMLFAGKRNVAALSLKVEKTSYRSHVLYVFWAGVVLLGFSMLIFASEAKSEMDSEKLHFKSTMEDLNERSTDELDSSQANSVRALAPGTHIGVVYQPEIDSLIAKIALYDSGSVSYQMFSARLNFLMSLQRSGRYSAVDDPNWQRALKDGYNAVQTQRLTALSSQFDNQNPFMKFFQGIFNGVGKIEMSLGRVFSELALYTIGHRLLENGKEFSTLNFVP
jgi:hypothetical protein